MISTTGKIVGALAVIMALMGSTALVAAEVNETTAEDYGISVEENPDDTKVSYPDEVSDPTVDPTTGEENVIFLHGRGTLFAMGDGVALLRGTGNVLIFASGETEVTVSSNAWVRALGEWKIGSDSTDASEVTYVGSGVLEIRGRDIYVGVSGEGVSLKASGKGTVTLSGDWDYWIVRHPRNWVTIQKERYDHVRPHPVKIEPVPITLDMTRTSALSRKDMKE
ncbi:MAG: hypothetical protein DRN83_00915 [Hadesarchaea archaeon]|nr:MAG: hypothetical protein DRN83_00915 [Hadesarchaea archaeon]